MSHAMRSPTRRPVSPVSLAPAASLDRLRQERGIALIAALMVTILMTALLVGFTTVVMSDQRYRVIDRNRSQAFYACLLYTSRCV